MVSVVTLSFNNYSELVQTLRSLEGAPEIESIVINGGDCSQTSALLSTLSGSHLSEKDHGIGDAFNKGLSRATGEAIAFLNSGDLLAEKNYYQQAQEILRANPSIDFVYADLSIGKNGKGHKFYATRKAPYILGKGMPFPHPSLVVRKAVFQKIGGFDTQYSIAMDFEWAIRLLKADHKGYYLPSTPIHMDDSGVSIKREDQAIKECEKALKAHNQYHGKNFFFFQIRKFKFHFRNLIRKTLGENALHVLKNLKMKMISPKS